MGRKRWRLAIERSDIRPTCSLVKFFESNMYLVYPCSLICFEHPLPIQRHSIMGLRNVVHRRNHKERSQPAGRAKLGLLEKHKDYVLRAKDHHSKRDRINLLKEKAAARNKDEFYFSMINTSTRNGVHVTDRGNRAMDNDVVQLLKTQDAGYLRAQTNKERRAIQGLVSRITPCVAQMRISWIEEKQHRKLSLLNAGLLPDPKKLGRSNSKKERQRQTDRWDQSEMRDEKVGSLGSKTVWVDGDDQGESSSCD